MLYASEGATGNMNEWMEWIYRVTQESANLKYSLVLTGMFQFKSPRQIIERFHSIVGCALNMENLILKKKM
jgi:hypothetical protein